MKKAVYAGSFDPITNGHIDIIQRATRLFDDVYVTIFLNPNKTTLFSVEERVALMKESLKDMDNVHVDASDMLVVDYAKKVGAMALVRGLRASQDYHYESMLAHVNRYLENDIETVFLMTELENTFISSSNIKEMASYGRDVSGLVPQCVSDALKEKFK